MTHYWAHVHRSVVIAARDAGDTLETYIFAKNNLSAKTCGLVASITNSLAAPSYLALNRVDAWHTKNGSAMKVSMMTFCVPSLSGAVA
jgi:hypothetical protein